MIRWNRSRFWRNLFQGIQGEGARSKGAPQGPTELSKIRRLKKKKFLKILKKRISTNKLR